MLFTDPPPFVTAEPNPANFFEWYYVIVGVPWTEYEGGEYCGTITFPATFPYAPPAIRMLTPSGRFKPGERICFSFSDYHPETWQPSWTVATILTALLSFMNSGEHTAGSVRYSLAEKRQLAAASRAYNENSIAHYRELFVNSSSPGSAALLKARQEAAAQKLSRPPPAAALSIASPSSLLLFFSRNATFFLALFFLLFVLLVSAIVQPFSSPEPTIHG